MRGSGGDERSAEFEAFYTACYAEIAGYVRRRVQADEADDVVAGVFTVAWRRFDRVPPPPDDRLWLFGVARNTVADHHRSRHRRLALRVRLAQDAVTAAVTHPGSDSRCGPVQAAMAALRPAEREALQLVLWDELSHAEAATVLGCSVNAFESRYRRARNAVRDAVASTGPAPGHGPASGLRTSTARETAS
ncbi:MAG TPA: RNA polymerase sigma factor [Streptosporangiaceae bacterium]|nr:RNA polymerase sigma factor [Streptosporangiaceae bacterium]